ncbi:MAG: hypothetical protein JNJ42_06645 [Burkholderiaceae bacterium]|nr:hypothetical protein [Burkholderiaceae bacterium]
MSTDRSERCSQPGGCTPNRVAPPGTTMRRFGSMVALVLLLPLAWLAPGPARADTLDDFISTYQKIDKAAPPNSLPVSAADLAASKGLFDCLASGKTDPVVCVDSFHDTPLGKKASNEAGVPSSFWQAVDAYIAYKDKDYWGVAYHLGAAATCAVVQVLLGGADACALIAELIEFAKDVYSGGKAVAEFFADLGEGAYNVAKDGYCATAGKLFGGCDSSGPPPKPKSQQVYEKYFKPRLLPEGLTAIESEDLWALQKLVDSIKAKAKAGGHADAEIGKAVEVYDKALDAQWSAHVVQQVLPQLTKERVNFNGAGSVALAAANAWARYQSDSKKLPATSVPLYCNQRFVTLGYSHVTRWVNAHTAKAAELKLIGNYTWCNQVFWQGNRAAFVKAFRDAKLVGSVCPGLGCPSASAMATCKPFMASVGESCVYSVSAANQPAHPRPPSKVDLLPGAVPQRSPTAAGPVAGERSVTAAAAAGVAAPAPQSLTSPAGVQRELAAVGCMSRGGSLHFVCADESGVRRCEAWHVRRAVQSCRLQLRR